jgi:hypothetical protein
MYILFSHYYLYLLSALTFKFSLRKYFLFFEVLVEAMKHILLHFYLYQTLKIAHLTASFLYKLEFEKL